MGYDWFELNKTVNGQPVTCWSLSFKYDDGTPCYETAHAEINPVDKRFVSSRTYLESQGIDFDYDIWEGKVWAYNNMAEYRSSGKDRFFSYKSNDLDEVVAEVEAYLDTLAERGYATF